LDLNLTIWDRSKDNIQRRIARDCLEMPKSNILHTSGSRINCLSISEAAFDAMLRIKHSSIDANETRVLLAVIARYASNLSARKRNNAHCCALRRIEIKNRSIRVRVGACWVEETRSVHAFTEKVCCKVSHCCRAKRRSLRINGKGAVAGIHPNIDKWRGRIAKQDIIVQRARVLKKRSCVKRARIVERRKRRIIQNCAAGKTAVAVATIQHKVKSLFWRLRSQSQEINLATCRKSTEYEGLDTRTRQTLANIGIELKIAFPVADIYKSIVIYRQNNVARAVAVQIGYSYPLNGLSSDRKLGCRPLPGLCLSSQRKEHCTN
jgi:hypothetical protein